MKSLMERFGAITDKRRGQGKRFELPGLLMGIMVSMMCGRYSSRAIARFCQDHHKLMWKPLGWYAYRPSHTTISKMVKTIDWKELETIVNDWLRESLEQEKESGWESRMIAVDGKAIRATVKDMHEEQQNFVVFVHAFRVGSGLIVQTQGFENKHQSEITVVEEMMKAFTGSGYLITMDALHAQKKRSKPLPAKEMSIL
jgi:hypothetical protein